MPSVYQFSELEILAFFLVLVRMTSFVITWPVFGSETVPAPAKLLLAFVLSLLVFPVIGWKNSGLATGLDSMNLIWLTIREAFIGLTFGYLGRLFFYTLGIAGEIISVTMGISSAQLFSPDAGERISSTSKFFSIVATLFFLAINGHHIFLSGIVDSFRILPLSESLLSLKAFGSYGVIVQEIMLAGLKISLPVMVSILFMNLAMAVIGRAVPQINVLITSLPINILVGYFIMIISLPLLMWQLNDLVALTTERVFQLLKSY